MPNFRVGDLQHMTTLPRFKCVPRCLGSINMDISKLLLCVMEYAYFTGRILHEHAADFQKHKPFEVGCNKFLLVLNDKFRRKKSSHVKPKNVGKLFVTQAAQSNKQSRPYYDQISAVSHFRK